MNTAAQGTPVKEARTNADAPQAKTKAHAPQAHVPPIDPITFSVIKNGLDAIVDEVAYTVIRSRSRNC